MDCSRSPRMQTVARTVEGAEATQALRTCSKTQAMADDDITRTVQDWVARPGDEKVLRDLERARMEREDHLRCLEVTLDVLKALVEEIGEEEVFD